MPESLVALERQRKAILARILDPGDFRSGSISAVSGRCGKPSCRCHQPGQPAHGPNYRLTRKVNGKTVSETFSSPAQRRKAQREVEAFHRFRRAEPTTARSQRTDLPLAPRRRGRRAESAGKKTAEAIQQEVAVEVGRLLRVVLCERRKRGSLDLEAVEQATRDALHQAGAVLLEDAVERRRGRRIAAALRLRLASALRRSAAEEARHDAGRGRRRTAVLSLQPLRQRLRAARPRAGRQSDAVFARRAPHDGAGRLRDVVRSRSRVARRVGRSAADRQGCRARSRGDRRRCRQRRTSRDRARRTAGASCDVRT